MAPVPPKASRRRSAPGGFPWRGGGDVIWYYHGSPIGRKDLVRLPAPAGAPVAWLVHYVLARRGLQKTVRRDGASGARNGCRVFATGSVDAGP